MHPMSLGDIIDGAFRLVRANAGALAPFLMLFALPFYALIAYGQSQSPSMSQLFNDLQNPQPQPVHDSGYLYLGFLVLLVAAPVAMGAVCRTVAASYRGEQYRFSDVVKLTPRSVLAIIVASFLGHLLEGVGLLACGVGYLALMPLMFLTTPAIVLEHLGPLAGLRRSFHLVSRQFWRCTGIILLSCLVIVVVADLVGALPNLLLAAFASTQLRAVVGAVVSTVAGAFEWALLATLATLLYFDQRIRQEGLDLEVMAARAA